MKLKPIQVSQRNTKNKNLNSSDDLFHHITQFIFMGELEEAELRVQNALMLDSYSNIERANLLRHLAIINIKKVEYHGTKEKLQISKNYLSEAIEMLEVDYPEAVKLEFQIELAKIYNLSAEFTRSQQLYSKILIQSRKYQEQVVEIKAVLGIGKAALDQGNMDTGLEYGLLAMRLLEDIENNILLIEAYNLIGSSYLKKRQQENARMYFNRALSLSESLSYVEATISSQKNLAVLHAMNREYREALQFFLDALEKGKSIEHRTHVAHCLINIGTIHAHLLNYTEALKRYSTAIAIYQDVLDARNLVILLNNIGNTYFITEKYDTAFTYFSKVLAQASSIEYAPMIAHAYSQLSKTCIAQQQFSSAITFANKSAEVSQTIDESKEKHFNFMNLAQIAFHQQRYQDAIDWANKCLEKARLHKDNYYVIKACKLLADIYENQNNFKKAAEYFKLYASFQEEWYKDQKVKHIIDAEIRYTIKEKEKAIEILKKENEYNALLIGQHKQMEFQNDKLRHINEELKQFAYVVSHDLKEPMRMIISYTQMLEKMYLNELGEDGALMFGFVKDGAHRMNTLLKDLLEYATIGRKEENIVPNSINDIISEVMDNLFLKIEETDTLIEFGDLPTIEAEKSLLLQLFQNLISNGIKFRSKEIPQIKISAENQEDHYLFTVKDNGIGIAKEYQERIFVMFQRLHSRKEYEGSGIGLAICQKIVHRLGGHIWLESNAGEGTTFYFTLLKKSLI